MKYDLFRDALKAYWRSTLFWLLAATGQLIIAWLLFAQLEVFQQIAPELFSKGTQLNASLLVVKPTFNTIVLLVLLVVPVFGMHLLVEERASGRLAFWYAAGISDGELLLHKFALLFTLSLCLLVLWLPSIASLAFAIDFDWLLFINGSVMLLLLLVLVGGISILAATLTRQAAISVLMAYAVLIFIWMLDSFISEEVAWFGLSLLPHTESLLSGYYDLSTLVYFLGLTIVALALAWFALRRQRNASSKRWFGAFILIPLFMLAVLLPSRLVYWQSENVSSLHSQSLAVLSEIKGEVFVDVFVNPQSLQKIQADSLLQSYRDAGTDIHWQYHDAMAQPAMAEAQGARADAVMRLSYQGRKQQVYIFSEARVTQALSRLISTEDGWIVFLKGLGAASIHDEGPLGVSAYARLLRNSGYQTIELDYREMQQLPANVSLLVLDIRDKEVSPFVRQQIENYLSNGGDILWLNQVEQPEFMQKHFGLSLLPGVIVDAAAAKVGIDSPDNAIANKLPDILTRQAVLNGYVTFASSRAFATQPNANWLADAVLSSSQHSWNEVSAINGVLKRNADLGERAGPLPLMYLLTAFEDPRQRVVAVANSYFLTNSQIGRGDNSILATQLMAWLHEQKMPSIQADNAGLKVRWSPDFALIVALFFTLVLPLSYFLIAVVFYRRRRKSFNHA